MVVVAEFGLWDRGDRRNDGGKRWPLVVVRRCDFGFWL